MLTSQGLAQTIANTPLGDGNGGGTATSTSFSNFAVMGQPTVGLSSSASFSMQPGIELFALSDPTFDLTFNNLAINPTTIGPGNTISISFDIQNLGDDDVVAGSQVIAVYLSTDQTPSAGEEIATIVLAGDVAAMGTYTFPQTGDNDMVTIPAATNAGSYFIIVQADKDAVIDELDETNNEASTSLTVTDDGTPPVIGTIARDIYFTTGSAASVAVSDNVAVGTVNFYHRGISTPNSQGWGTPVAATFAQGVYSVTLDAAWQDDLGVEYWFEAFDTSNNRDTTDVEYTYFQTPGGELTLPSLKKGRAISDFEIISVPFDLTQKDATALFSAFGTYNPKKWRMFQYTGGSTKEYGSGWNQIKLGESYWIINDVTGAGQILIGEARVPPSNKTSPHTMNLIQGWNQIGNPYRFNVSWNDVLVASGNPTEVERFRIFNNGNFGDGTTLSTFKGGFVFTNAPVTISIPVTPPPGSPRLAKVTRLENPLDDPNWEVNFLLSNEEQEFIYGGFGMREDASPGKDLYDEVANPRFIVYSDVNFEHPEYFIPRFNKDVVPTMEQYQWAFTVESNSEHELHMLAWDNTYFGENEKELVLFDVPKQRIVDMRETDEYVFTVKESYEFKVFYGDPSFLKETIKPDRILLGKNYPNPFSRATTIPFTLPAADSPYDVQLRVINHLGQHVKTLWNGDLEPGFIEVYWNAADESGKKVDSGIYLYQLIIDTPTNGRVLHIGKMAIK